MKCPRCGTRNPNDAKYCEVCGYTFIRKRDDLKRNKIIHNIAITETKICKKCGWINPAENIFCEKCGGELEIAVPEEKYDSSKIITSSASKVYKPVSPPVKSSSFSSSTNVALVTLAMIVSYVLGILTGKIL